MRRSCKRCAAPGTASVRPAKLLRTSTFRSALVYLALFGLSVVALFAFVYWNTAVFIAEQTDDTIKAEITGLAEQYREGGLIGLLDAVRERGRGQSRSLYLITDPRRRWLAGNLDAWPQVDTGPGGWLDFIVRRKVGRRAETHHVRARHLLLRGGFQLLVGRDVQERHDLAERLRASLIWIVALTIALGLLGGVAMSRNMLRKIDAINRASRDIMAGDLSRRVAVSGSNDELDRLAQNLNAMLGEIERLMTGMRQVTDNVAHDLRTPLNRLRGRLEVTLMAPASEAAYRAAMEETIAEAEGLLKTFNALLGIAEAESGAHRGTLAELDAGILAADVAELYTPLAEEKGIRLACEAADGLAVTGDRHLLSQALANLADNAVKYTAPGGSVTVVARRDNGTVELAVADTGPGIAAADRGRVLERFQRLEASRNSPGSGLGLSLVAAVARLHGAELVLDDNHPGLRVSIRFAAAPTA